MIINEKNAFIINTKEVYLHDDILTSLYFDKDGKFLELKFCNYGTVDNNYSIKFRNVIGFAMTACDFWGAGECVLDFEYVLSSEQLLIPRLQEKWDSCPKANKSNLYNDYIETLFTFSSGDQLRVASKTIEIS